MCLEYSTELGTTNSDEGKMNHVDFYAFKYTIFLLVYIPGDKSSS